MLTVFDAPVKVMPQLQRAAKSATLPLNARTGALLWKQNLGGEIIAGPISFQVDGKQYITIASGNSLFAFALRE